MGVPSGVPSPTAAPKRGRWRVSSSAHKMSPPLGDGKPASPAERTGRVNDAEYDARMVRKEREILEHAVHTIAEQAAKADELVDEAKAAGGGDHPVTVHAKMLRLELLKVKADLERELEDFSLNCTKCGLDVHWVSGLGVTPGHWGHREPAPHGEPAV